MSRISRELSVLESQSFRFGRKNRPLGKDQSVRGKVGVLFISSSVNNTVTLLPLRCRSRLFRHFSLTLGPKVWYNKSIRLADIISVTTW